MQLLHDPVYPRPVPEQIPRDGSDTTFYGSDLKLKDGLAQLLVRLEKLPSLKWIRLMYSYPGRINEKLIETIVKSEKIVHYLDVPLQHINNNILKSMRRPDTKEQIVRLIDKLRTEMPDMVLRTTMIVLTASV
jgi:ribosomal protein S12 methylthiotransferase